jgi:hypothetical protein
MTYWSCGLMALAILICSTSAEAHGRAGNRLFPATLAVEDPAVADELTLPTITSLKQDDNRYETEYEGEFSKRITDKFGISIEKGYKRHADEDGFDNWGLGAKYQAYTDAESETIVSVGLGWEVGETGTTGIGENRSSLEPQLFIGKGFGDLPDWAEWAKPFALTGALGYDIPLNSEDDEVLKYGFTIQYSIPYLQQRVKDIGLGAPFSNVIPVVEFAYEKPTSGTGQTTGTVNPGLIWSGEYTQFGLEAVIPTNDASGRGTGIRGQVHFYLDDLVPVLFKHR